MKLFNWLRRPPPCGIHFGAAAARWASTRFPSHLQPTAAYVADVLCEQVGLELRSIEPGSTFIQDLHMDDLEPVEFVMVLEEELGIQIPAEDYDQVLTVSDMVSYLHQRLTPLTLLPKTAEE